MKKEKKPWSKKKKIIVTICIVLGALIIIFFVIMILFVYILAEALAEGFGAGVKAFFDGVFGVSPSSSSATILNHFIRQITINKL